MLALLLLMTAAPPDGALVELVTSDIQLVADQPAPAFGVRSDAWDTAIRERGWILRDGDRWRLWYTGYDGTKSGLKQLGLASSSDLTTFDRVGSQPVTPPGLWVEDVCIVRVGRHLEAFAESPRNIVRLLSADGTRWISRGKIEIVNTRREPIADGPTGTPVVVQHDDRWWLLYERYDRGIWVATSQDRQRWTLVRDEPVFEPSGDGFDAAMIAFNQVVRDGDRWVALYHGADQLAKPRLWAVGAAVSDDLLNWERSPANPLTTPAANLSSPMALPVDDKWAFVTTHGRVDRLRIDRK